MSLRAVAEYMGALLLAALAGLIAYAYIVASFKYSDAVAVWINWGQPVDPASPISMVLFAAWWLGTVLMIGVGGITIQHILHRRAR